MKTPRTAAAVLTIALGTCLTAVASAQDAAPSPATAATAAADKAPAATGAPSDAEIMAKMIELAKLGENHKLLAELAGAWDYKVKLWMTPDAKPIDSGEGMATCKAVMGGRYFVTEIKGKARMPGADGKLQSLDFTGMSMDGYDNVKKKFVSTWTDNMGTGMMLSEGDYDAAAKTFTYHAEMEMMPGMKSKVREVLKVVDKNHHVFEFFEERGGQEVKTMEIDYLRKK